MTFDRASYMREYRRKHPDARSGDRHRSRGSTNEPLQFVSFDGEGSEGLYQLLACSATEEVLSKREGLSTLDCFRYFMRLREQNVIRQRDVIIGFGLGYDFENMLRDLSDAEAATLAQGKWLRWQGVNLRYVPHKFLDLSWKAGGHSYSLRLQDIYPYFQQSFVKACAAYNIPLPEIVLQGKRARSSFSYDDIDKIKVYNRAELEAMVQLGTALYRDFKAAFEALEIPVSLNRMTFYGPGAQAAAVLRAIGFLEDFVLSCNELLRAVVDELEIAPSYPQKHTALRSVYFDPFVAAYFGGRIEASMQGRIEGPLYDYDLLSAYPFALSRLPALSDARLVELRRSSDGFSELDSATRIGIYYIHWKYIDTKGVAFHPFPYRAHDGNVFFPPEGQGWVMSPEIHAANRKRYEVEVYRGFVFEGTEGFGDASRPGTSATALFVQALGAARAQMKREGNPAHRGMKLVANSLYGKTLQKTGSHRYFKAFVAAWITSVTRARIYQAIGPTRPGVVVSVMTDGILSTQKLKVVKGQNLGDWEESEYARAIQFTPGVYVLDHTDAYIKAHPDDHPRILRYRGFTYFDVDAAIKALESGVPYEMTNKLFVGRAMSQHVKELRTQRYRFIDMPRSESFSLNSKRDMRYGVDMPYGGTFYPAKQWSWPFVPSWPYKGVMADPDPEPGGELAPVAGPDDPRLGP